MCIRDSIYTVSNGEYPYLDEGLSKHIPPGIEVLKKSVWEPYACLLYTSDAADERSSVDLGGRRIIKKKKTDSQQQRTRRYKKKTTLVDE